MIADYTKDPALFERCINLIDAVFPGCKSFALNGMKYKASWPEVSIPFIVENASEIIAHAGVLPLTLTLNGKLCQLNDIIKEIPGNFTEVRLQFCPDRFLDEKKYTAIAITSTQYLMTSRHFSFDGPHFRYPELYWC